MSRGSASAQTMEAEPPDLRYQAEPGNEYNHLGLLYVTDPEKCYKIQDKYGWELLGYEEVGGEILKVKCIYEGETQFPSYFPEDD